MGNKNTQPVTIFKPRCWVKVAPLPKSEDSERSVGLVTGVATQVTAPEVIVPDVAQGCCWSQILEKETQENLHDASAVVEVIHRPILKKGKF